MPHTSTRIKAHFWLVFSYSRGLLLGLIEYFNLMIMIIRMAMGCYFVKYSWLMSEKEREGRARLNSGYQEFVLSASLMT